MSVLVTGGAGFLGRALVAALTARGEQVVSLDRAAPRARAHVVEIEGDITDGSAIEALLREHAVTRVIHGAAVVGVTASVAGLADTVRVNIDGSVALFEAIIRAGGVQRVVDLSSEEVYGDFAADPVPEEAPAVPVSPYGITKYAVERLGNHYGQHHELPYVATRLCWVYGAGFPRRRLPRPWLDDATAGRPSALASGGDQRIDLTHVDDAVRGVLCVLDAEVLPHRAYNIATGTAVTMRELAEEVAGLYPTWDVELGGGRLEMAPGVYAACKGALDISRARALGFAPQVSLAEGLARSTAAGDQGVPA